MSCKRRETTDIVSVVWYMDVYIYIYIIVFLGVHPMPVSTSLGVTRLIEREVEDHSGSARREHCACHRFIDIDGIQTDQSKV